ncbi:MAG TPA: acyltransferase [Candidatus Baltobacteraceae bacterium]|jgi:peptidoglycan/LPS O-acetylase OafA/YrhL
MAQNRLGVLDGLRGIAVLLVLWYHVWEISWLPAPLPALQFIPETGFVGVHLFFFISGFVIVYPFLRAQFDRAAAPGWSHFYYRRFLKIVPSYVLSILVIIAIGYAHFDSAGQAARDIITHILFVHTWFAETYGSINGVLWTLAVEVQFYAIFPLLWLCFKRAPWITAGAMTAVSLLYRHVAAVCCLHTHALDMIDNLPGYLDIFAAGMMSAYLYLRLRDRSQSPAIRAAAVVVALGGFAFLIALLENLWAFRSVDQWSTVWQFVNRTWIGVAFAIIALGSLFAAPAWKRALANPVLLFFAAISYNLYLYHQPLARELLWHHIPPYATANEHGDPHWQVLFTWIAFGVTIAQAALVTYVFERPLLRVPASGLAWLLSRLTTTWSEPPDRQN